LRFIKNKKYFKSKQFIESENNGFSINELVITILMIGIIATFIIPNFTPTLEFIEVLIVEKYLLKSVKECQLAIVNDDPAPQYSLPLNDIGLGIVKNKRFVFSHTGLAGDCAPYLGGNIIQISRINTNSRQQINPIPIPSPIPPISQEETIYSLQINVATGERISEGKIPQWLNWWEGIYSPIIPENDSYFLK
tara:strand:+ start:529 stop:1107 length:579 start_codon:yes stop_codon:yes gene_type:complete